MGKQTRIETYFRNRLKNERERRGWSLADMANRLSDKGINFHMTTVAKIEAGQRAVRIDEAAAIADLFEVSLDALLGRGAGLEDDLAYSLRSMKETVRRVRAQVQPMLTEIADARDELDRFTFHRRDQIDHMSSTLIKLLMEVTMTLMLLEIFTDPEAAAPSGTTVTVDEYTPEQRNSDMATAMMAKLEEFAAGAGDEKVAAEIVAKLKKVLSK
jgi:transcriptional regulator with XRE-family HTH domain